MIPVVAIVGKSGTGKTAIIEKLIREFKAKGYRVASIKHTHQAIDIDTPGKDTWRFSQAGSDASVLASTSKIAIFKNFDHEPDLEETVSLLGQEFDIVLAEGFKNTDAAKIEIVESGERDLICKETELCAVISDENLKYKIPRFNHDENKAMADFIEKEIMNKMPCDMTVVIDGKPIFLKPFVKDIIANSILAMLSTLKNVAIIRNVIISIRNKM